MQNFQLSSHDWIQSVVTFFVAGFCGLAGCPDHVLQSLLVFQVKQGMIKAPTTFQLDDHLYACSCNYIL